jgi:hypothetical protein
VDQSPRHPLVDFHRVPLPDQLFDCDIEVRDARFAALALRASDMGIGSGMTSIISSLPRSEGEWEESK